MDLNNPKMKIRPPNQKKIKLLDIVQIEGVVPSKVHMITVNIKLYKEINAASVKEMIWKEVNWV